ncbi:hypothetical protein C6P46_006458 [Rhodotorula mucilaginosa]|uniref:Uncharacterized protein n=1 Tax=Rhodotorula mucilaginosa TaxID=5537 RepID=A0A9P6W6Y9_RHOMI|nr:hypothetical protein C6P46_006458 [Rhodotorula mucilaginosa]
MFRFSDAQWQSIPPFFAHASEEQHTRLSSAQDPAGGPRRVLQRGRGAGDLAAKPSQSEAAVAPAERATRGLARRVDSRGWRGGDYSLWSCGVASALASQLAEHSGMHGPDETCAFSTGVASALASQLAEHSAPPAVTALPSLHAAADGAAICLQDRSFAGDPLPSGRRVRLTITPPHLDFDSVPASVPQPLAAGDDHSYNVTPLSVLNPVEPTAPRWRRTGDSELPGPLQIRERIA